MLKWGLERLLHKEVTQACYLAILNGEKDLSSEDADDDNDDDAESCSLV